MSPWQKYFISRIGIMLVAVIIALLIPSAISSATSIMDNKGIRIAVAIAIYAIAYFVGIYIYDKVTGRRRF